MGCKIYVPFHLLRPVDQSKKWVQHHKDWAKTHKAGALVICIDTLLQEATCVVDTCGYHILYICGKHLFDFIRFSIFLEVSLKKSMKAFGKAHPEAAKLVSVAREMHALDLLTCHHGDNLACLNISQSLHCMPMISSHADHLPCLT